MKTIALFVLTVLTSTSILGQKHYNIEGNGCTIHFEVFGKGKPMLIINGGPGMNSKGFRHLASIMGKSNMAIIYDQRGTGQSTIATANETTITTDLMIEDIEKIRIHLNIKEWVIFGHSFGGMLGSYYATKHPDHITGLILSSSGGIDLDLLSNFDVYSRLTSTQVDSLNYWSNQIENGDTSYHAKYQLGKNLAPAYLFDKSNVEVVAHRLTQGNMEINALVFEDMQKIKFDCSKELASFDKPILIIQGNNDVIKKSISEKAHNVFPQSTLIFMDQCAHYGWLDQPEQYFGAIDTYLAKLE